MAPISEKRPISQQMPQQDAVTQASVSATAMLKENGLVGGGSQSHGHGHHHHHHHHNQQQQPAIQCSHSQHYCNHYNHHHHTNSTSHYVNEYSSSRTGLEILDFHESWLEEMEAYKDMMHIKRLGLHSYAKKLHASELEAVVSYNAMTNKMSNLSTPNGANAEGFVPAMTRLSGGANVSTAKAVANANTKRRNSADAKQRVRVATSIAAAEVSAAVSASEAAAANASNTHQLHLKRPREETPVKTAGSGKSTSVASSSSPNNAKRFGHSSNSAPQSTTPITNARPNSPTKPTVNAAYPAHSTTHNKATASSLASSTSNSAPKNNTKIIVNQFHASSLLNGHPLEEKEKILTQNGLFHNAPATAYEASFYAANYLNPDSQSNITVNGNALRSSLGEPNNYVGVSLAKNSGAGFDVADDDPSAEIDNVNTYSDSDTDDEYTGEPFYLKEDGNETMQSKNIHYHSPEVTKPSNSSNVKDEEYSPYYTPKAILTPSLFPNVPPYLNYSSHARSGPPIPQQLHKVLKWKLSPIMPKIVKRVVLNSGFRIIKNTMDWMAVWEKHMKSPGFRTIRSHQKYNHMPGSFRIGRKDSMWRAIQINMKKFGNKEFGFMQRSYIMPDDVEELRLAWPKNASRLTKWIVKPPASARGTGISIVNKWSQFPKDRPLVVQKYIERPLLINDNKFDMRIYVVLTSINPLRIYMYKDGLARFASVKYSSELTSLDERCMHLTNYSINKFSVNYTKNEDFNACQGHKWTLQSLWSCLEERGVNTKRLWATLRNLVVKALVSGEAGLNRMYRQNVNFRYNCFELFGFDVLLDENLVPWLLEINISPSLHSELPLDLHVKGPLIQAVLNTALYQVPPKLTEKQQKEILDELQLEGGVLCHDKRIFTTCLRPDEIRKHNQFTTRSVEYREEYLDAILEHLNPDDVRCLLITEDELNRSSPLERVFPTADTHKYLKFVEHPRYYNRLLDAWEHRYSNCRNAGIQMLRCYCKDNYHLQVPDGTLEKEPSGTLTEIDLLHIKKEENNTVVKDDNYVANIDKVIGTTAAVSSSPAATSSPPNNSAKTNTSTNIGAPAKDAAPETKAKDSQPTGNQIKTDQVQPKSPQTLQKQQQNKSHSLSNKEPASHATKHHTKLKTNCKFFS